MGEDSDNEEEVEEEEERDVFQPIDVSSMPDGPSSLVLGGWSALRSVDTALEEAAAAAAAAGAASPPATPSCSGATLLVCPGRYEALALEAGAAGVCIVGTGEVPEDVVFAGVTASVPAACVTGVSFRVEADAPHCAAVRCDERVCSKVSFTRCVFAGGRRCVVVHAYARPTFVGCTVRVEAGTAAGVYGFPRSRPSLRAAVPLRRGAPLLAAAAADARVLATLQEGDDVVVLGDEEGGGDAAAAAAGFRRVACRGTLASLTAGQRQAAAAAAHAGQVVEPFHEGYVARGVLDEAGRHRCSVAGCRPAQGAAGAEKDETDEEAEQGAAADEKKKEGEAAAASSSLFDASAANAGTGVFLDDSRCTLHDVEVSGVQTGVYLRDRCEGSVLQGVQLSEVFGVGVYLDAGCRTVLRGCRVRGCGHYGLVVARGGEGSTTPSSAGDSTNELCAVLEAAENEGDEVGGRQVAAYLAEQGVVPCMGTRTWACARTRAAGRWEGPETRSIVRDCVFASGVRLGPGTAASFFGTKVVAPHKVVSQLPFATNGLEVVSKEPRVPVTAVAGDDEEE